MAMGDLMTFREFLVSKKLSPRSVVEAERAVNFLKSGRKVTAKSATRHVVLQWSRDLWAEFSGEVLVVPGGGQTARLKPAVSMPDEDWDILYGWLQRDDSIAAAVLRVMMTTGLRIGDVLRLPADAMEAALHRSDGVLEAKVKGGDIIKSSTAGASRNDWVRLAERVSTTVAEAVSPYGTGSADGGDAAYKAVSRALKAAGRATDLTGRVHLHRLRRTTLVQVLRAGADITVAKAMAGHKSLKTTEKYTDETIAGHAARGQDAIEQFRRGTRK
jgi:integrase